MSADLEALEMLYGVVLETGEKWGDIAEPFQVDLAKWALDRKSRPNRWESRPRGGSKTTDIAAILMVAMLKTLPVGSRSYVFAVDKDQARLLVDAAAGFVARTPSFSGKIAVDSYKLTAVSGSVVEVLASDAPSAWGLKPAFLIADEFCQHPSTVNAKALWQALFSAMGKVKGAKLLCTTTSGDPAHFSHEVYEAALKSRRWEVAEIAGPLPWIDEDYLDEQRAILPDSVYRRLHLNEWASAEDRLSTLEDVRACIQLDGPLEPDPRHHYIASLDLGWVNDKAVVAVAHKERTVDPVSGERTGYKIVLDLMRVWAGTKSNPVNLDDVEQFLGVMARRYGAHAWADPAQAVGMIQRLRSAGVAIEEYTFTQPSNGRLAMALHLAIRNHRLALPNDPDLIDELVNVRLRETSPGTFRLDHDPSRHDDRAVALGICVVQLLEGIESSAAAFIRQISNTCPHCDAINALGTYECTSCGAVIGEARTLYGSTRDGSSKPVEVAAPPVEEPDPSSSWPWNMAEP